MNAGVFPTNGRWAVIAVALALGTVSLTSCSRQTVDPGNPYQEFPEYEAPAYLPYVKSITPLQPLREGVTIPADFLLELACDGNPLVLAGYEWLDRYDHLGDPGDDPQSLNVIKEFYTSDADYGEPTRTITLRPWIVDPPMGGAASSVKTFRLDGLRLEAGLLRVLVESTADETSAGANSLTYRYNNNSSNSSGDYFIGSLPSVYKEFTLEVLPAEAGQ